MARTKKRVDYAESEWWRMVATVDHADLCSISNAPFLSCLLEVDPSYTEISLVVRKLNLIGISMTRYPTFEIVIRRLRGLGHV
jgi:hypothetical protein